MLNITLTIDATPEFLAALSSLTNSITSTRVVTVQQSTPIYKPSKADMEQSDAGGGYNQSTPDSEANRAHESGGQQMNPAEQMALNQVPTNLNQVYYQENTSPINSLNNQNISVPVSMAHVPQQAPIHTPAVQAAAVPTSTQNYTMEQLAVAATQLVDAGRRSELVNLLQTFGVQALTALPKEQYGAFATQLRALGAKTDNLCVQNRNAEGSKI